jgi:hypothetical protein
MPSWEASIISKDAKYRNTTNAQSTGVWGLNEQLRHAANGNWQSNQSDFTMDAGYWTPNLTIIQTILSADDTSNFNVLDIDFDGAIADIGTTGRLYIAAQVTATTTFYNDFVMGAVQILTDSGSTIDQAWSFDDEYSDWERGSLYGSSYSTLSSVSGASWTALSLGSNNNRWNAATSTSSLRTGAADGINSNYGTTTILSAPSEGDNPTEIPQVSTNNFIYIETSGTSNGTYIWCRSPEFTIGASTNVRLRIAYHACTTTGVSGMKNDSSNKLLNIWWD